jgi:hypothetical protein
MADEGSHPIQDGGAVSQSNWYMSTTNSGANLGSGQWGLDFFFGGNPWGFDCFTLGARDGQYTPLQKGQVYRFEIQVVRTAQSRFRFHVWVYNSAGNLLYDDNDFHSRDGSRTLANYEHTFNVVANTSIFLAGWNGIAGGASWPIHSSDQAAFAVVQGFAGIAADRSVRKRAGRSSPVKPPQEKKDPGDEISSPGFFHYGATRPAYTAIESRIGRNANSANRRRKRGMVRSNPP